MLGRELMLVPVHANINPQALATATERLLSDNGDIIALLGLSDTNMVLAAAPVAASHGRVFLTSGATSPRLPSQDPNYLFLACFGDNVQAAAGAEWAYQDLGARTALVLYDLAETYTDLLHGYFTARFPEPGGAVTQTVSIDPRTEPITRPSIGDVDLVFLSVLTAESAARVVPLLRAAGYTGPILGGDAYDADGESARRRGRQKRGGHAGGGGVGARGLQRRDGNHQLPRSDRTPTKGVTILRVADGWQVFVAAVTPQGLPYP